MIRFDLKCANDHSFDSWFGASSDYEKLKAAGMITCPTCGSAQVEKSLMAPGVSTGRKKDQAEARKLAATKAETALKELRKDVEKNSEYVGENFATEARSMHLGESEARSIYGQARPEEAKSLIDDGIPVTPLPFMPKRNTN